MISWAKSLPGTFRAPQLISWHSQEPVPPPFQYQGSLERLVYLERKVRVARQTTELESMKYNVREKPAILGSNQISLTAVTIARRIQTRSTKNT